MARDDVTYRMPNRQLVHLIQLTAPTRHRTSEIPAVELEDLLRKDRDLDATPVAMPGDADQFVVRAVGSAPMPAAVTAAIAAIGVADPFAAVCSIDVDVTERVQRPVRHSAMALALTFVGSIAAGIALTLPLW